MLSAMVLAAVPRGRLRPLPCDLAAEMPSVSGARLCCRGEVLKSIFLICGDAAVAEPRALCFGGTRFSGSAPAACTGRFTPDEQSSGV